MAEICMPEAADRSCGATAPTALTAPSARDAAGLSRRRFAQLLGAGATLSGLAGIAGGSALRAVPLSGEAAAPAAAAGTSMVRLSSNENPYGPSPAAFSAMRDAFDLAWRYPDEHAETLAADLARLHGLGEEQVALGAGSSEILHAAALAFTAPGRPAVTADPTFEALPRQAQNHGAEAVAVPLTADFRHDLPRMLAAAPDPGILYICNPNNPTATITPKDEVRALLARVPERTVVLVDEAYFHFADRPDYESVVPLVASHPNLLVTRTFSKIYGMAGLRCGYGVAQTGLIARLRRHQAYDGVNVLALAAARASLKDAEQVSRGRRLNSEVRAALCTELDRLGFAYLPSAANFMMIDLRQPVGPVIKRLHQRGIDVGREFPALPHHLRVTIGTAPQVQAFAAAFSQVATAGA